MKEGYHPRRYSILTKSWYYTVQSRRLLLKYWFTCIINSYNETLSGNEMEAWLQAGIFYNFNQKKNWTRHFRLCEMKCKSGAVEGNDVSTRREGRMSDGEGGGKEEGGGRLFGCCWSLSQAFSFLHDNQSNMEGCDKNSWLVLKTYTWHIVWTQHIIVILDFWHK